MHPNAALIQRFYTCFQARDAAGMRRCYHPALTFHDPVFEELIAAEAGAMWSMLCARTTDLEVRCSHVSADEVQGRARWEASYTFEPTGRAVHNRIEASFRFREGLIVRHEDQFSLWGWLRQAFGPVGLVLGWSPLLRKRVRTMARRGLQSQMRRAAGGGVGSS